MSLPERLTILQKSALIYVVDDDESVLKSMKRLLRAMGFAVETYPSAWEFLCRGSLHSHGCVIVDMRMPEMDGLALQNRLSDSGVSLPVVFMTAYEDPGVRSQAMQAGALAFLRKPFSSDSLIEALCLALEQSRKQISGDVEGSMDSRQGREEEITGI